MLIRSRSWILGGLATIAAAAVAWAAPIDGKWTWKGGQNQDQVMTLELKADGEKLTGNLTRNDQKTEIKEGTIKGSDVAFVVVRERNGQEFKQNYKAKLDGDTLKGTISFNAQGEDRTREWTATRVK